MLAQKEDVCAANTKCLTRGLCWGSAHAVLSPVSRGCLAHPAPSGTAFSLSSFFPPPLKPVLTHEQQGQRVGPHHQQGQTPSLSSSQMGLTLPQQPGEHVGGSHPVEKSFLPQTHSSPITKSDRPGTPPGISGGFLMQHSGRIFVPGFALN